MRSYDPISNFHLIFRPINENSANPNIYLRSIIQHLGVKDMWFYVVPSVFSCGNYNVMCDVRLANILTGLTLSGEPLDTERVTLFVDDPLSGTTRKCSFIGRSISGLPDNLWPHKHGWDISRMRLNPDCYGRNKLRIVNLPDLQSLEKYTLCAVGSFPLIMPEYNESHQAYQVVIRYNDIMDATYAHYMFKKHNQNGKEITCRLEHSR